LRCGEGSQKLLGWIEEADAGGETEKREILRETVSGP